MSIRQEDMPGYARAVAADGHTYYGYYFRHQKTMPAPLTYKSKDEVEKEEWEENTEQATLSYHRRFCRLEYAERGENDRQS